MAALVAVIDNVEHQAAMVVASGEVASGGEKPGVAPVWAARSCGEVAPDLVFAAVYQGASGHQLLQAAHVEGHRVVFVSGQQHQTFRRDFHHPIGHLVGDVDAVSCVQQLLFG